MINRTSVCDGVPHPPQSVGELEILPGVSDALARLHEMGLPLIVVTNQPDVARGAQTREQVERINERLRQSLPLDAIYVCYHDNVTAANAGNPSRVCSCARGGARNRPGAKLDGGRPVERRGGGSGCRVQNRAYSVSL